MKQETTLGKWIIHKFNTKQWRENAFTNVKSTRQIQPLLDLLGREQLLSQAKQLEKEGFLHIKWGQVNTEIKELSINMNRLDELCCREKVDNPRQRFTQIKQKIQVWLDILYEEMQAEIEAFNKEWLVKFYADLLGQIERTTKELPKNARDEEFLVCLNEIAHLQEDIWKRQFSSMVLHDSKKFEDVYQGKVIQVLCYYSERVSAEMEPDEVLSEFKLLSYSQVLECKGDFRYELKTPYGLQGADESSRANGIETIQTGCFKYGHMLNAQTLIKSQVVDASQIRKVMTIENKANYEDMIYNEHCLYIYTHGFFSFKERAFLASLNKVLSSEVEFYHWSDMDYGGIRIYQFIKNKVFIGRTVQPWKMGHVEYLQSLEEGNGREIDLNMRAKIEVMQVVELEELKKCILEYGKVFEQEQLIGR